MSESPRSSSRLAVCAVLLLCAGAGAWYHMDNGGSLPGEKAPVPPAEEKAADDVSRPQVAVVEEQPASHQVSGALVSGPEQAPPSPEEKMQERVDSALASASSLDGGDSAGGVLSQEAPPVEEKRYDPVVTPHFVSDLAAWLAESYRPSSEGRRGRSTVTLRAVNARYSSSASLRSVESDVLKGRASILRYVYSPGMLEALYRMYGPDFVGELETAARAGRKALDQAQTADMFRVYAAYLERVSAALSAASRVDVKALAAPIRQAASREEAASEAFGKAYAEHSEARDAGRRDIMSAASERMTESARAASQADARRERARGDAAWALRQKLDGPSLPDADLVFLVEWLDRRDAKPAASAAAADICRRMAADLISRAEAILAPAESIVP